MKVQRIYEGEGFKWTVLLKDDSGTLITSANISAITMSYYNAEEDESASNIINSRTAQAVKDANNCTMGASDGLFTWNGQPADAAFRDQSKDSELHVMELKATHSQGGSPFVCVEGFRLINRQKQTQTQA